MSLQEYLFTGSSKATSCGFGQKRVRLWDLLEGGLTALQEPISTVLMVLPKKAPLMCMCVWAYRLVPRQARLRLCKVLCANSGAALRVCESTGRAAGSAGTLSSGEDTHTQDGHINSNLLALKTSVLSLARACTYIPILALTPQTGYGKSSLSFVAWGLSMSESSLPQNCN